MNQPRNFEKISQNIIQKKLSKQEKDRDEEDSWKERKIEGLPSAQMDVLELVLVFARFTENSSKRDRVCMKGSCCLLKVSFRWTLCKSW